MKRDLRFECPLCGQGHLADEGILDVSQSWDDYYGFECENLDCDAVLKLVWSDGHVYVDSAHVVLEIECPRDGEFLELKIEEEGGCESRCCDSCGAEVEVTWTDWELSDSEIIKAPVPFHCPVDGAALVLDAKEDLGGRGVECPGCGSELRASWDDWQIEEVTVETRGEG